MGHTPDKWDNLCHDVRNGCVTISRYAKQINNAGIRLGILKQVKRIETALFVCGLKDGTADRPDKEA